MIKINKKDHREYLSILFSLEDELANGNISDEQYEENVESLKTFYKRG